jgi:hypothetical protein
MATKAQIEAAHRIIKQKIKQEQKNKIIKNQINIPPPDLGISVGDGINTNEKFG